jgi:hypothetical protein
MQLLDFTPTRFQLDALLGDRALLASHELLEPADLWCMGCGCS